MPCIEIEKIYKIETASYLQECATSCFHNTQYSFSKGFKGRIWVFNNYACYFISIWICLLVDDHRTLIKHFNCCIVVIHGHETDLISQKIWKTGFSSSNFNHLMLVTCFRIICIFMKNVDQLSQ